MVLPNLKEIFTDFGNDGLAVSFREFLGYFVKQFWPGVSTQVDKLPYMRLDYPLLVLPFFLLAIIASIAFWERPTRRRGVWAGLTTGLLLYVYFNTWVYWVIVLGFLSIYAFMRRRDDPARLAGLAACWVAFAAMAIPFAANYLSFSAAPGAADYLYRQWIAEGREPGLTALGYAYLLYAFLAAAVMRLYWPSQSRKALLFLAMIAAMVMVWNVQLLTGFVPAPDHWKRIISVVIFIILFQMGADLIQRMRRNLPRAAAAATVLIVLLAAAAVAKKIVNAASLSAGLQPWVAAKYAFPPELADSWAWISEHLPGEPKIISPSTMTSQYLAVYTAARPVVPYGILTPLPMAEIEQRVLTANRLFGVSEDRLRAELGDLDRVPPECAGPECFDQRLNFTKTRFNLYGCYFFREPFNAAVNRACAMPDEYREAMVRRYRQTAADWSDVDADYVYYGPHERQFARVEFRKDPRFTLVYENPLVEIYRIEKK